MRSGLAGLTDKEKATLRLMVRGHDAKSMARQLDLSVHTINDRLRNARRKLDVTSSREAARLLLESERTTPENPAGKVLGAAQSTGPGQLEPVPQARQTAERRAGRKRALLTGGIAMSVLAAMLLLASPLVREDAGAGDQASAEHSASAASAASAWLELLEARDWSASYAAAAASFREANTLALWSDAATRVQGGLGKTLSRELLGVDDVPSPQGITIVRYRTDFTNRAGALVTVSLVREEGAWKVAGIYVA